VGKYHADLEDDERIAAAMAELGFWDFTSAKASRHSK